MSTVINNCNLIKGKVASIISQIELAEDYLRSCQNSLSEGVIVSGTSLGGDMIDNVLRRLDNVKARANSLSSTCSDIITKIQNASSSSNDSSSSTGSSNTGSSIIRGVGGGRSFISEKHYVN